ncbi:MAG: sugar phosphate isomerase/epimerase [Gemmatimonadaceae bacterium]
MAETSLPRRSFLTTAAFAGASLGVAGTPSLLRAAVTQAGGITNPELPLTAAPTGIKLGVASYSLREFPLDKALEMVNALRTPYVNFKSVHVPYEKSAEELAAIRKQIEAVGLTIVGGGTITFDQDTDAGVEKYFAYARDAGMPTIVCTGDPIVLPRVERFAKQYDIKVAIHNHGPEDHHFPSPYDVLKHVKGMDPRMGLCIDVGHTARTGADVVKAVLDAGTRLHDMHMKDLADPRDADSQVAVGEGKLPIAGIFRALETIKFPGYVNLEYEINAKDPLPGMQLSFAHMRGVLAGLTQPAR